MISVRARLLFSRIVMGDMTVLPSGLIVKSGVAILQLGLTQGSSANRLRPAFRASSSVPP